MQSSLYDRLGGKDAITAVVDDFVATCANDSRINAKFAKSDVPRLKAMLVDQGVRGHGRTVHVLRSRHDGDPQGVGVTTGEFDAFVEDLVSTLGRFSVPAAEQAELLGLLGPMKPDIVEMDSPETGAPLPDTYEPAPSLGIS